MAAPTGLLLLTSPSHQLFHKVPRILRYVSQKITQVLYIHLHPDLEECLQNQHGIDKNVCIPPSRSFLDFATKVYVESSKIKNFPDTRILLRNTGGRSSSHDVPLLHSVQEIYTDSSLPFADVTSYLKNWILFPSEPVMHQLPYSLMANSWSQESVLQSPSITDVLNTYHHVVLGGTFDRLHVGHKVLLMESAMRANAFVTVGVTDGHMNHKKTLPELLQPCGNRIQDVYEFLHDVKPWVAHKDIIVPITDPFGPSITEADMGCIVVSQETRKGGAAVNKRRLEKDLNELDIHEIQIISDDHHGAHEEDKISSSSQRMRLLGSLLCPPEPDPKLPKVPYVIGLTGGIASGKTSVCRRLEKLGAGVIDCDKLGHLAYLPGTDAFQDVVKEFGTDIVGDDGHINRKALGAKVFADKSRLTVLNQIVWPAIARKARELISQYANEGRPVCILDAAVLLEAHWDDFTHEIWSCIIPKKEAMQRIMDRDKLSEDTALQRIESQMSNEDRVQRSHVVLCTYWQPEYTQQQVEKAWKELQSRTNSNTSQL